jgi:hypothetical protein
LIKNHGFRVLYDDTKDVFLKRDAGNVVVTFRSGEEKWFKDKKDYSEGEFVKSLGR